MISQLLLKSRMLLAVVLGCFLAGCTVQTGVLPTAPAAIAIAATPTVQPPTATALPTPTPTTAPLPTLSPTPSPVPTITATAEPYGCLKPPEDYTRVEVNGWLLNRRTLAMLEHAQQLYDGELEITGYHITQGSYTPAEPASFGTHDGGGAVDLSVLRKGTWTVLWDEIEPLIAALRAAGFAAWLREYGELYPDSPYHIHAVAIGDADISPAAQEQLTGTFGYFRGYTGVPIPSGVPALDRHGGPVLCQWMIDLGYADLRSTSLPDG